MVEGSHPTYTLSDVYDARYHAVIYPATQRGQTRKFHSELRMKMGKMANNNEIQIKDGHLLMRLETNLPVGCN